MQKWKKSTKLVIAAIAAVGVSYITLNYEKFIHADFVIEFVEINVDDLVETVTATGQIKPLTSIDISSQLSGQIDEVLVDFNDRVRAGQVLARLNSATQRVVVRQAKAEVELASAEYDLAVQGIKRSEAELANVIAERQVIAARLEGAEARHKIREKHLQRKQALHKRRAASNRDFETAEGEWLASRALVREHIAQRAVQKSVIAAARAEVNMAKSRRMTALATLKEREAA